MRALLSRAPGGPETLSIDEAQEPVCGPGEVVVRVRACGVNYPDVLIIEDKYQFRPERPFSPGGEIAGDVESVGEGVTSVRPGDRIIGFPGWGGMAEKLKLSQTQCVRIPESMPYDVGAAFLMTYGTSWHALKDRAVLRAGETLLVLGAAGGVGLAAVELGRMAGARVIAAVSSQEKADLARAHGAHETLIYGAGPFDKEGLKALGDQFKSACGPAGADVVYDPVGGDYAEAALRAIAWEGRYLVVGFPAGIPKIPLNLPLLKGCAVVGVFWGAFAMRDPSRNAANTVELLEAWGRGDLKPVVSERYPLARGGDAIARLSSRQALGKIVVTVD